MATLELQTQTRGVDPEGPDRVGLQRGFQAPGAEILAPLVRRRDRDLVQEASGLPVNGAVHGPRPGDSASRGGSRRRPPGWCAS